MIFQPGGQRLDLYDSLHVLASLGVKTPLKCQKRLAFIVYIIFFICYRRMFPLVWAIFF